MKAHNLPKSLQKHASRIADYSDERDAGNGIHIAYEYGWKSSSDPLGCVHGEIVDSISEAAAVVRYAERCNCNECVEVIKKCS